MSPFVAAVDSRLRAMGALQSLEVSLMDACRVKRRRLRSPPMSEPSASPSSNDQPQAAAPPPSNVSPEGGATAPRGRGPLKLVFLIVFCDLLGFSILFPLLPFYATRFDATPLMVGLLTSVYSVCQLVSAPVLGMISDRRGRRPVLVVCQVGSAVGLITLGLAALIHWPSNAIGLAVVFFARVLDGISGGNISTAQAYIGDVTTQENRARGMGVIGAAFGIGFATGPALGGVLGHIDPSLPCFAGALCCLTAAALSFFKLPESLPPEKRAEAVAREKEALSWTKFATVREVFADSVLSQLILSWTLAMAAFVMLESTFALFLHDRFGFGELGAGLFFALAGVVIAVVQGGLIGRLTKAWGEWTLVIAGPLLVAAAMFTYVQSNHAQMIALLVLAGLLNATGRSFMGPSSSALVSKMAPPDKQGAVFGVYHGLGSLSRVLGPAWAGWIYERTADGPFISAGILTLIVGGWLWLLHAKVRRGTRRGFEVQAVNR
jgi:DHA1 family tetracycline resistance protein-like MFS transporter